MWDNSASNWVRHRMVECLMCYGQLLQQAYSPWLAFPSFTNPNSLWLKPSLWGFIMVTDLRSCQPLICEKNSCAWGSGFSLCVG